MTIEVDRKDKPACVAETLSRIRVGLDVPPRQPPVHPAIAGDAVDREPQRLTLARRYDALAYGRRRLASVPVAHQLERRRAGDVADEVDAIEQRPGEPARVAHPVDLAAAALTVGHGIRHEAEYPSENSSDRKRQTD